MRKVKVLVGIYLLQFVASCWANYNSYESVFKSVDAPVYEVVAIE